MANEIRIKRGLDISLQGKAASETTEVAQSKLYGLKPTDFNNLTPKLSVKAGDEVKIGSPLFYDKYNPDILFTSPVSGKVTAVNRGERRRILEIVVESDGKNEALEFKKAQAKDLSKEEITENLLKSGCWAYIIQRPYVVIANPKDTPRDIFVSAFNSAPLAPDYDYVVKDNFNYFQAGIDILAKLSGKNVKIGTDGKKSDSIFTKTQNADITKFTGPHPAGNVGIQINNTQALNKGEIIWTVNALDVVTIGKLFAEGKYDATKIIALTGSEVKNPKYYKTIAGVLTSELTKKNIKTENYVRIISGNVLTGEQINENNYIGFYADQITIIPEGNKSEFLGWGTPGLKKFSVSKTFFSWLSPKKERVIDTNMRGGERPFIVTGSFEKVFPMDIYPVQLLKAIMINDIDLMEELGIYEVAEEDFALCEVISTSKIEIQRIVREGLNSMIKEFS